MHLIKILLKELATLYSTKEDEIIYKINTDIQFGHISFPLFQFLKYRKEKDLNLIFNEISNLFANFNFIEKMENLNGFLNIYIIEEKWQNFIFDLLNNSKNTENSQEKIMIEYSSPNPGKSFHIGHLRNTLLGQSLFNLYKKAGQNIYSANYLNDTGLHIAKLIYYFLTNPEDLEYLKKEKNPKKIENFFAEKYALISQKIKDNENENQKVKEIYQKIEENNEEIWNILNLIKEKSLENFNEIYKDLNVKFDYYFYDSEMLEKGKNYVMHLVEKGIAKKDEGAIIVDLNKYNLNTALILKSDGSALYITKDLALAQERFKKYNIDKLVYVVGVEQTLHFKQVFKILELDGFKQAKNCQHLAYELVQLKEGKMSSRLGNVVTYRQLKNAVFEEALKEIKNRYPDESPDWQNDLAEKIALSAIKVWILKYDNNKKIIFDIKKALDFAGDTGPYLLYTYSRLNSLLRKSETKKFEYQNNIILESKIEKEIMRFLAKYPNIYENSKKEARVALLMNYILDLAKLINHYYHEITILNETDEKLKLQRLFFINTLKDFLKENLTLLTIDLVDKM